MDSITATSVADWEANFDATFQDREFQDLWDTLDSLSDEEKRCYPDSLPKSPKNYNNKIMDVVCGEDPVLNTAVLPSAGLELDTLTGPLDMGYSTASFDDSNSHNSWEEEEQQPTALHTSSVSAVSHQQIDIPSPDRSKTEEFVDYPIEIHNYSKPPTQESMMAGDEVHYDQSSDSEEEPAPVQKSLKRKAEPMAVSASSPVLVNQSNVRRSARQPKRAKKSFSSSNHSDSDDEENETMDCNAPRDTFSNGKRKLYSLGHIRNNPAQEKARQNAINAKKNRDRKKQEKERMENEMAKLQSENQRLSRTANQMRQRALSAEEQLQQLQELLRQNNIVLKAPGNAS